MNSTLRIARAPIRVGAFGLSPRRENLPWADFLDLFGLSPQHPSLALIRPGVWVVRSTRGVTVHPTSLHGVLVKDLDTGEVDLAVKVLQVHHPAHVPSRPPR